MSDNEQDGSRREDEELNRRALSRAFLQYLRPAARLRAEYRRTLHKLADISQIVRDSAEDDLEQDLDWAIETLLEGLTDPSLIEGRISEAEAEEIVEGQGAFEKHTFEGDEELYAEL